MAVLKPVFAAVLVLIVATQAASAQRRCPSNSHSQAIPIPGNLATAQCFCDPGFTPVNGRCARAGGRTDTPSNDPARVFVAPMRR